MTGIFEASNRELCERYPYLLPRNVWTDKIPEDYNYSYTLADNLPDGWRKLFLLMCEHIREPLVRAGCLDDFRFSQIKEKYGTLRAYHFGAPADVESIIRKYEHLSSFVCTKCGAPALYMTTGYILPYCGDCVDLTGKHYTETKGNPESFESYGFVNNESLKWSNDCHKEWEEYLAAVSAN